MNNGCHNKRIRRNKVFAGFAKTGKNTMGWFYGFKLHLLCNYKGELLSFCLTPGNVDDRDPNTLKVLTKKLFGKLFGDKGYISSSLFETLFDNGVHLVTGIRNNMKNRLMSLYDKIMLRKRSFRAYLSPGISVTQGVAVGLSYLRASPYGVTRFESQ